VPLFGLQWLLAMRLPTDHALKPNAALPGIIFRRRCFFVSLALAAVSVLVVKILGRNAIPLSEITVIPEVLKEQRWARFDLRALCIISVQTVLMLLPALLLFASGQRGDRQRAIHPGELAVGLGMTVVAVYFWKKSLLPPLFFVPFRPASGAFIGMLQLIPVPFAGVLTARLLRSSLSARTASGEISTLSSTLQVLFVIIVSNVLVLPVLQHPVLRHSLPAFVAAVMAVGLVSARGLRTDLSSTSEYSNRGEKPLVLLALCGVMLLGSMNVIGAYSTRQMTAAQWDMAESLRRQGVPAAQIEGGWAWFCVHHLQPALPQNESYVTRFKRLEDTAAYRVTYASQSNSALRPNERVLSKVVVASAYGPQTLRTLKRGGALPAQ
jgi:hypothetical protein